MIDGFVSHGGAQFAPAAIEKATDLFVDELWKTCIPDTSVVIFNSRKYKQALNTVLKSVLSGDEVKIPDDLPESPPRKYRADISLYNLFPTNADESPSDHVGGDVEYFTEGEDLEFAESVKICVADLFGELDHFLHELRVHFEAKRG